MIPVIHLPAAILTVLFRGFFDSFHSQLLLQTAATSPIISSQGIAILGGAFIFLANKLRKGTLVSTARSGSHRTSTSNSLRRNSWFFRNLLTRNHDRQANALNQLTNQNMNYLPGGGDSPRRTLETLESPRRTRCVPSKYIEYDSDEDIDSFGVSESVLDLSNDNRRNRENTDENEDRRRRPLKRGERRMNNSIKIGKHLQKLINRKTRSGKIYNMTL